ncbi:MAG: sigma-70 family polymerase sigma factor [Solirubrobacteraceae bacterium]|nr:sigma-70 family polymerase sigma factor [Solirubrobacteraceae bacterium]
MSAVTSAPPDAPRGPETEDSTLVRRVRRGDDRAFEQLYHRYHRRITAYIQGMVHDHARAEDIAQDVFVSALRRMRDTDRPIAFKPWIYEIAKNACIDQFRRSRRAEEVSYDADEGMGAADYGRLVSGDAMPEARLDSKQSLDDLCGAFGGLSEAHHEILVMRELEGLSYREIGERLGMSRPSVESTLFRARRRLTEEYEELVSGARCQRIQGIIAGAEDSGLGARDERRLARHVSHCQPCRRQARLAGLDVPVTADRPMRQRIAALFPLPLFLRKRWSGGGTDVSAVGASHASGFAQWSAQLGSTVDPSWIKAAATAATVAVAGVGAGMAGHAATPNAPAGSLSAIVSGIGSSDGAPGSASGLRAHRSAKAKAPAAVRTTSAAAQPAGTSTAKDTQTAASATPTVATTTTTETSAGGRPTSPVIDQVASQLQPGSGSAPSSGSGASNASGSSGFPSSGSHVNAPVTAPALTVPASAPDPAKVVSGAVQGAGGTAAGTVTTVTGGLGGG